MATGGNCGGYNNLYIMADGAGIHKANNSSAGGGKINSISLAVPPSRHITYSQGLLPAHLEDLLLWFRVLNEDPKGFYSS